MFYPRPGLLLFLICLSVPLYAQQAPSGGSGTTSSSALTPAAKDPQAVSILNQALAAAGGSQAIHAVSDFTGTGTITYYPGGQINGTVTVQGLGQGEVRIDAIIPAGTRSWAIHQGVTYSKSETGKLYASNSPTPLGARFVPYRTPLFPTSLAFPTRPLASIVGSQTIGLVSKAPTQADDHAVYDVQVYRAAPTPSASVGSPIPTQQRDLLIDNSTFQIVMMREVMARNVVQEVHYSNYQPVNGVLMPFAITEDVGGRQIWTIQLSQISFNSGLQPSSFVIQ